MAMQTQGIRIRELELPADWQALKQLDTTFTTDMFYEVEVDQYSFRLIPRVLEIPVTKQFKLEQNNAEKMWDESFVAFDNDNICGFIAYGYQLWNKRLSVWHFYVAPEQRRKGIGTLLMERLLQKAKDCGAMSVWLETSNLNFPAIQMYQSLGFSICGLDTSLYLGTECNDEQGIFLSLTL